MGILDDIRKLALGEKLEWDQPYETMTTKELVSIKVRIQRERDASSDAIVQAAYNARMAIVNKFLDQRVGEDDADRILKSLSPDARKAISLRVQNIKQESKVSNG